MTVYESIGDLNIKNTLVIYKHQFYCPHSFRLYNEFEEVIRNNNILVLDLKDIGRLEWVYVTPLYFDKVGQMVVGRGSISEILRRLPKTPTPAMGSRVVTGPVHSATPAPLAGLDAAPSAEDSHEGKFVGDKFVQRTIKRPNNDDINKAAAAMMASRGGK